MSTFNSPTDVAVKTLARSHNLNDLDAACAAAFALLPDEDNLDRGKVTFAVDTGAANAYLVSLAASPGSYVDGLSIVMRPTNTNTGASTIDVNSIGVKSIRDAEGNALAAGEITIGVPIALIYSTGTGFFHCNGTTAAELAAAAASAAAAAASEAAGAASESAAAASAAAAAASAIAAAASAESVTVRLDTANEWTAQQNFNEKAITSSSNSVAWNLDAAQCAAHVMTENTTIAAPTNMNAGATYVLRIIQGSGPYTLAFNAAFDFGSEDDPAEPAAEDDVLILSFYSDGSIMYGGEFTRTEA